MGRKISMHVDIRHSVSRTKAVMKGSKDGPVRRMGQSGVGVSSSLYHERAASWYCSYLLCYCVVFTAKDGDILLQDFSPQMSV